MLKKAADFGVDNFFISGAGWTGEPLMRKDFLELIRYVWRVEIVSLCENYRVAFRLQRRKRISQQRTAKLSSASRG